VTNISDCAGQFADRRILVTGAAGFLGKHVVRQAINSGAQVTSVIRPGTELSRLDGMATATLEVDLRNLTDVADAIADFDDGSGFDVIHCASNSGHAAPQDHVNTWNTNLMATVHLLSALRTLHNVRLVHIGAGTEYGQSDAPLREEFAARPVSVRGASKLAATTAVLQWACEFQKDVAVVRPFSVYGLGEPRTRLISTLLRSAATGETFSLVEGTSRRDLVSVNDVAEGVLRALSVASPIGPLLNLATGIEHSIGEVLQIVESVTGKRINLSATLRRREHHDLEHWVGDTSTCERLLEWKPGCSLESGITDLWHLSGGS
jgi:nucleoside-diphosphate-sugar epimerase